VQKPLLERLPLSADTPVSSAVHEAVTALKPSWGDELEITEAIPWLLDNGRPVSSTVITGYWKDTGNVTDMVEVNRLALETIEPRLDGIVGRIWAL
jgi:glucose-1-phosphate thymidylyltransferase